MRLDKSSINYSKSVYMLTTSMKYLCSRKTDLFRCLH